MTGTSAKIMLKSKLGMKKPGTHKLPNVKHMVAGDRQIKEKQVRDRELWDFPSGTRQIALIKEDSEFSRFARPSILAAFFSSIHLLHAIFKEENKSSLQSDSGSGPESKRKLLSRSWPFNLKTFTLERVSLSANFCRLRSLLQLDPYKFIKNIYERFISKHGRFVWRGLINYNLQVLTADQLRFYPLTPSPLIQ